MKRMIGLLVLMTAVLLFGWMTTAEGQTTLKTAWKNADNAFTVAQGFAAGMAASAGQKVGLEGTAGDTYLIRDADTGCVQEWKDGSLHWQFCTSYSVPPDCASSTPTLPFGGMCKDQTGKRVLMNTGNGVVAISGVNL